MKRAYKREGECHTHVHLTPAIIAGWNVERIEVDREGFAGMSTESIAAFIDHNWADASEADPSHVEGVIARYERRQKEGVA
jgi:hypothetical protein